MVYHAPGVVPPGGTHLLLDCFGAKHLDDINHVTDACTRAAWATGATIIGEHFHHFGDGCGISGVVLLAESHLSIHTWPENGIATIDIFVCGTCIAKNAIPILKEAFAVEDMVVESHRRGVRPSGRIEPPRLHRF